MWLCVAVLEMASELVGCWASSDNTGSSVLVASVYILSTCTEWILPFLPCKQKNGASGGPRDPGIGLKRRIRIEVVCLETLSEAVETALAEVRVSVCLCWVGER